MERITGKTLLERIPQLKSQGKTEKEIALELGWSEERKNIKGVQKPFALVAAMRQEIVATTYGFESKPAPKARNNTISVQATGSIIVSKAYTGAGEDVKDITVTMKWKKEDPIRVELDTENNRIILQKLNPEEKD